MDARGAAAALAVSLTVSQAADAALAENRRLRCAIERAATAVTAGDRALALRLLALALDASAVPVDLPRGRGPFVCCMCGRRARTVWTVLPSRRQLCGACYRMQPR